MKSNKNNNEVAQSLINIKMIEGNVLFGKNNQAFAYLSIAPINVELFTEKEKINFIDNLSAHLSSERDAFKILCISKPINIVHLIDGLNTIKMNTTNPKQKELLIKEIKEYNSLAISGNIVERQFYLSIWDTCTRDGIENLLKRARELRRKFEESGVRCSLLERDEIIRLCNLFTNPTYAYEDDLEVSNNIPLLDW